MMKERIYVGGFAAPYLASAAVMERLQKCTPSLEISNVHLGSCYCQFDAASSNADETAMAAVSKLYNNVTWKGFKLRVQPAKPHFLDRLKQEQNERDASKQQQQLTECNRTQQGEETISKPHPRHLRVKRAYGQEAYKVDTKPITVRDWDSFNAISKKIKRKRVNSSKTKESPSTFKTHLNRSIHLKFSANVYHKGSVGDVANTIQDEGKNEGTNKSTQALHPKLVGRGVDDGSLDTSVLGGETSEVDNNDSALYTDNDLQSSSGDSSVMQKNGDYAWSDDDEASGSTTINENIEGGHNIQLQKADNTIGGADTVQERKLESSAVTLSLTIKTNKEAKPSAATDNGKYVWSDDSDTSVVSEESQSRNISQLSNTRTVDYAEKSKVLSVDEFSAGFNAGDDKIIDDDEMDENTVEQTTNNDVDLNLDVEANLSVFASLFPEAKPITPSQIDGKSILDKEQDIVWKLPATMQRYDPRKQDSEKYVLPNTAAAETVQAVDESDDNHSSVNETAGAIDIEEVKTKANGNDIDKSMNMDKVEHLYEQDKLEKVFQEARQSEVTKVFDNAPTETTNGDGQFTFGFNLDDVNQGNVEMNVDDTPNKEPGAFSFAFDVSEKADDGNHLDALMNDETQSIKPVDTSQLEHDKHKLSTSKTDDQQYKGYRRRGKDIPEADLYKYIQEFLLSGSDSKSEAETKLLVSDAQAWKNDANVKKAWHKRRKALTLDYKRKARLARQQGQDSTKTSRNSGGGGGGGGDYKQK